jgi:hypothetical protein
VQTPTRTGLITPPDPGQIISTPDQHHTEPNGPSAAPAATPGGAEQRISGQDLHRAGLSGPPAALAATPGGREQKISAPDQHHAELNGPSAALTAIPGRAEQTISTRDLHRAGLNGPSAALAATPGGREQKISALDQHHAELSGPPAALAAISGRAEQTLSARNLHRAGLNGPSAALAAIPGVRERRAGVAYRLGQLSDTSGWSDAFGSLRAPESSRQAAELLSVLIDAAVLDYLAHGHANPVMLVHASTAPTAVLRTLPALPEALWIPSLDAAWLATAAVTAAYRNTEASAEEIAAAVEQTGDPREGFDRAVRHGDEHVVKFVDTALDSYERTGDKHALAAATRATLMIKVS